MNRPYFIYEITPRCNNNCLYCYNIWKENKNYPLGELSIFEIQKLFEKIFLELIPQGVTLTGGEPLLHPDILKIVSFLKDKNIKTGIATNGVFLDDEMADKLTNAGVNYFEISLNSINPKTYNKLSSNNDNNQLKKVKKAILNIKKYKAKLTISSIITKLNLSDIENIIDFAFAFSADSFALNRFIPNGNGISNISKLQITNKDIENILSIAERKSKKNNLPINITVPIESCVINYQKYNNLNFGACVCGKNKWVIDPLGNLRICEQNSTILGNLFESSFLKLSQLDTVKFFQDNNLKTNCKQCNRFEYCGGGCRFLENNSCSF